MMQGRIPSLRRVQFATNNVPIRVLQKLEFNNYFE
jgi:hypothetical protein